jgi:hypothetical protein
MKMHHIIITFAIAGVMMYGQGPRGSSTTTPPTPAQMAQRETDRLTRFFTLTATQQTTVLGLLTTADTQTQALTTQIKPLRTSLEAAIKANNQSMISLTILQISSLQEQEEVIRANVAGQIYATVLTSTQQALVGTGLGPLMGGGPGGGGPGPGPGGFRGRR